jgi:hypothetical protein
MRAHFRALATATFGAAVPDRRRLVLSPRKQFFVVEIECGACFEVVCRQRTCTMFRRLAYLHTLYKYQVHNTPGFCSTYTTYSTCVVLLALYQVPVLVLRL